MKKLFKLLVVAVLTLTASSAMAAFTSSVTETTIFGGKLIKYGTYTNTGGSTGGEVVTNLSQVQYCQFQPKRNVAVTTQVAVDEVFPIMNANGAVTIATFADEVGYFMCFGY